MFTNNNEVLILLQNVVNQNFFNTKSLIILEDSTSSVNGEYKFPFEILDIINPLLMISPFIILGIVIIKFTKTKRLLKNTTVDEDTKKQESKKALRKLIAWIVASGIWGFILENLLQ